MTTTELPLGELPLAERPQAGLPLAGRLAQNARPAH